MLTKEKGKMFKQGNSITDFFDQNSDLYGEDFYTFVRDGDVCDAKSWREEYSRDARLDDFELGVALARKASKKVIFKQEWDEYALYFIGTEKSVLNKLKTKLKVWLLKHPPEQRLATGLKEDEKRAEKQLEEAQIKLNEIRQKKVATLTKNAGKRS